MTRKVRTYYKGKYVYAYVSDEKYEAVRKLHWQYVSGYAMHYYKDKSDGKIRHISMHRFVMGCKRGDGIELDHIDRNKLNNTDENLRKCTHHQNVQNAGKRKDNTTGYIGIYFEESSGKWAANVQSDGKQRKVGRYKGKIEAALAYDAAVRKYHGEFARTNFDVNGKRNKL